MIAVGLSSISSFFQESLVSISWVVTIYLITMAVTQPIAGKMGDIWGNRTVYLWGVSLFFVSSIACAFSFHLYWLIFFRSLQAIGGALITPNAAAILRHAVSKDRLPKVFGLFGMGMGVGAAIGPLMGSTLISIWGWQSIFWVNIPFLLFTFAVSLFVLPQSQKSARQSLDLPGSFYLAVSFTLFILLTNPRPWWESLLLGVFLLLFVYLFVQRETKIRDPLIDFSLLKNRTFTGANLSILVSNFIMYTTLLVMPLLLESDFRLSHQQIGWVMFVFSISMSISGWIGGQLTARFGSRMIVAWSFAISILSSILFLGLKMIHSLPYLLIALTLGGIAGGIGQTAMQTASLQSVPKEMAGTASGIYSTFRYFGSMIASTLVSLWVGSNLLFAMLLIMSAGGIWIARGIRKPEDILPASSHSM
ncbi:MFS transporter [Kroppenstedtia pulmonis]|uniref:MFS transporter n=2 Tax=Kroppenstedtia pulmonis TaxID=1380685 RepID=A0A7D3XL33_9BACL|nr:MFS transporter [Kroppenstedtia pulmonis]